MPELAEVELARRQWLPALRETISSVHTHPGKGIFRDCPAAAFRALKNHHLSECRAHGKRLLFSFAKKKSKQASLHLELHLGMSGRLYRAEKSHSPGKHDHFILFTRKSALCFNDYRTFGRVILHDSDQFWRDLPPAPHDRGFTSAYLKNHLTKHPKKPLKALLLDQAVFPRHRQLDGG